MALFCINVGFNGFQWNSFTCNHIDIAPNFAGTLMGITNMVANTAGFLAPMAISHIIEDHVRTVFIKDRFYYKKISLVWLLLHIQKI